MQSILDISNIKIGFEQKEVQKDLSFQLSKGSIVALLGENGSGKSTLIKTLSGVLPLQAGRIFINGHNFSKLNAAERSKQMAFVFTNRVEIGLLKVEEFIAFGRYPYNSWLAKMQSDDIQKVNEAIEYTGLEKFRQQLLSNLSDGEKQKVMIARAIAQDTPILVLDEPTTHLDFKNSKQIFELIKRLGQSGKTIIFSSHQLEAAANIADYFLLLKKGAHLFCDRANYASGERYCDFLMED